MIPSSSTLTESPAATVEPLKMKHFSVCPVGLQASPISLALFVSVSTALDNVVRSVPDGNVIESVLPAAPDNPPVEEVTNPIVYTVSAPAAADGDAFVTVT